MGGKVGRTSQGQCLFRVFRRPLSVSSASRASGAIRCRWDVGWIGYRVFCHVYYLFCRRKPCGSAATKTIAHWAHSHIPFWEFTLMQLPHCARTRWCNQVLAHFPATPCCSQLCTTFSLQKNWKKLGFNWNWVLGQSGWVQLYWIDHFIHKIYSSDSDLITDQILYPGAEVCSALSFLTFWLTFYSLKYNKHSYCWYYAVFMYMHAWLTMLSFSFRISFTSWVFAGFHTLMS